MCECNYIGFETILEIFCLAEVLSPLRDPGKTRTRFEGLLEGAIKMYSNEINHEVFHEINANSDVATRPKENRGRSAVPSRLAELLVFFGNIFSENKILMPQETGNIVKVYI